MAKDELETVLDLDIQVIRNMVRTWPNFPQLIQQLFLYFDTETVSQKGEMRRGHWEILYTQCQICQVGKLHLYHGEDDGWSPLSYRDNLLREVPELGADARIDTNGIPHAFVEFDGVKVGEIVGDWIKEIDNK